MEETLKNAVANHCHFCKLCIVEERLLGGVSCKKNLYQKFKQGQWHDGIEWHPLRLGRAVDRASLIISKSRQQYIAKNNTTKVLVVKEFTQEHLTVMQTWSAMIKGFWNIKEFINYMSTHPFSRIIEFRHNGTLIGFDWIIELNELIIHQLLPWLKKEYSTMGIGVFAKEATLRIWERNIHLYGEDGTFKKQFGGWTYEGTF